MNNQESIAKTKQTRIKRAPERYNEDGTYNNKPKDPDYFNNYYHLRKELTMCEHCKHSYTCLAGLNKHLVRSAKCRKLREAEFMGAFTPTSGNESRSRNTLQDLGDF